MVDQHNTKTSASAASREYRKMGTDIYEYAASVILVTEGTQRDHHNQLSLLISAYKMLGRYLKTCQDLSSRVCPESSPELCVSFSAI
jgi:hypothetical protein